MKIAILTLPIDGHLNPLGDLGTRLCHRGHEVVMLSLPSGEKKAKRLKYPFKPLGKNKTIAKEFEDKLNQHKNTSGLTTLRLGIKQINDSINILEEELPLLIKEEKIELFLIDQMLIGAPIIPLKMKIPYITVCAALEINRDKGIPPHFSHYGYGNFFYQRFFYNLHYQFLNLLLSHIYIKITKLIKKHRLNIDTKKINFQSLDSKIATISQSPPSFAFKPVAGIHYAGPFFLENERPVVDFPWEKLKADKTLIYASLGTLFTGFVSIYQKIAEATKDLNAQVVISLGRNLSVIKTYDSQIVVPFAPQIELLKKTSLFISHGGMNSVLESLKNKVPLLVIPIAHDQPGVARRVKTCGAGEFIKHKNITTKKLKCVIQKILKNPSYQQQAAKMADDIIRAGGGERACDIIEKVMEKEKIN